MTEVADYVRQVEAYLCRKNGGHLIRIVGPAFELVSGWAASGVPLKIAFRGIDRCCERQGVRGVRRRPMRIEFCEADVLDTFDAWRRAVGVAADSPGGDADREEATPRKPALAAHIERAIARMANVRGVGAAGTELHQKLEETIRELEQMLPAAPRLRGGARAAAVTRLGQLDSALLECAIRQLTADQVRRLRDEAAAELAPFGVRMPADARTRAAEAAFLRLVREEARLPSLSYE